MTRAILVFVAIAYTLSIALSLVVGLTGGYQSPFVFGLGIASMFVPAIAVLIVDSTLQEKVRSFGWNRLPLKYLPVALLLMPVVMHAVMLPLAAALWGRLPWEDWLTPHADGLYHTPVSRGWGVLTTQGLVARIALTAVIMPIVIVGAGLVIGWLWVRTESIWLVAFAHGALNNWGQYAFKFMGGPGQLHDGAVLGAGGLALLALGSLLLARGFPDNSLTEVIGEGYARRK